MRYDVGNIEYHQNCSLGSRFAINLCVCFYEIRRILSSALVVLIQCKLPNHETRRFYGSFRKLT